jgi:hypothetical protein
MSKAYKAKAKRQGRARLRRGPSVRGVYDIAGAVSATRGSADALTDAKGHLPLLGNQFENRKMLYYEYQQTLTGAAGILDTHYYSANGIFDPDITGTGHQPIGFDQAMLFYEQFVVFRSTCTVTFYSNTAGVGVRCGVFLNPDTSNPSIYGIMENGYMASDVVAGTTSANSGVGYHLIKKVSLSCDSVAFFDSKTRKLHAMRDSLSGTAAANPAEQVYFGIFTHNFVSATTYEVFFDVELSYDARFWEPRKVSSSLLRGALSVIRLNERDRKEDTSETTCAVHVREPKTTAFQPMKARK